MSKCPDCGRENYSSPAGYVALCGRRVEWNDSPGIVYPHKDQWRERMMMAEICRRAALANEQQARDAEEADTAGALDVVDRDFRR